jgi:integrase
MQRGKRPPAVRIASGTFAAVIRAYQNSPAYREELTESTRRAVYGPMLRLAELHDGLGGLPVEQVRPALVQAFLDGLADKPGSQKNARTAIKAVERWALVRDLLPFPISTGTTCIETNGGHEPWSMEQVKLAEQSARPDLARVVTLAVHTGQRGSDIVKMRWSDIEEQDDPFTGIRRRGVNVVQQKTGRRLWVPFTAELSAAMETWEKRMPPFLILKPNGQQYTRAHLSWHWNDERDTNKALEPLKEAGLVLHGLRATAVVRARKAGATVLQIASMFGMSEPMVARYSRLADQTEMAMAAVHFLDRTAAERKSSADAKTGKLSR